MIDSLFGFYVTQKKQERVTCKWAKIFDSDIDF